MYLYIWDSVAPVSTRYHNGGGVMGGGNELPPIDWEVWIYWDRTDEIEALERRWEKE